MGQGEECVEGSEYKVTVLSCILKRALLNTLWQQLTDPSPNHVWGQAGLPCALDVSLNTHIYAELRVPRFCFKSYINYFNYC